MKKKFITILLTAFTLLLTVFFTTGCNKNTLTINNTEVTGLSNYGKSVEKIIIPDRIEKISSYAFHNCTNIKNVIIGNNVTTIGAFAFYGCSNLESIIIPNNITDIDFGAFENCTKLSKVCYKGSYDEWVELNINSSNSNLNRKNLYYYVKDNTNLPTSAGNYWCYDALGNVKTVHNHDYVSTLTSPTCTEQGYVTHSCFCGDTYNDQFVNAVGHTFGIVSYSWDNNKCTATRVCSKSNKHIETETTTAFFVKDLDATCISAKKGHYVAVFTNPAFKTQVTANYSATEGDPNGHDYVAEITKPTCTEQGFTTFTCHCNDTYVGDYVNATGHDYVAEITKPTCTEQGFTTFTCHCNDTYVGDYVNATGHDYSIIKSNNDGTHTLTCSNNTNHSKNENCSFTYISNNDGTKTGTCKCGYLSIIADTNVLNIENNELTGLTTKGKTLSKIVIPNFITSIKSSAFSNCTSLTDVTIPNSVKSIGSTAFKGCTNLAKVNYIGSIDEWAQIDFITYDANPVYYAKNLYVNGELVTQVNITTATTINSDAFLNCQSITSVIIGDTVTCIEMGAFSYCINLATVSLGNKVEGIDMEAFYGCSKLNSINLPDSMTYIDDLAFANCTKLTTITISSNITYIGLNAFEGCSKLTTVYFMNTENWNVNYFTPIDVTNAETNALNLTGTYCNSPWDNQ